MAQQTIDGSVQTTQTPGWAAQLLRDGPKLVLSIGGLVFGAGIVVRMFIGVFVEDYKLALIFTAVSCVFLAILIGGIPALILAMRETSKASIAGVSQQVSEMSGLVRESLVQNNAVMNALIAVTSRQMGNDSGVQLPVAPQPVMKQIQPAQPSINIDGRNIGWDKLTVDKAAAKIYYNLYSKRIEPTQSNIKDNIRELQSTSLISAAMQELKSLGWAESNGAGSGYKWVYDDAPAHEDE
jgi:hypothetical protein